MCINITKVKSMNKWIKIKRQIKSKLKIAQNSKSAKYCTVSLNIIHLQYIIQKKSKSNHVAT